MTLTLLLRILAFVFLVPGAGLVFASREIVKRLELDKKQKCDFAHEMGEEELAQYKISKAIINLKVIGMLVAIPGVVLVLIAFITSFPLLLEIMNSQLLVSTILAPFKLIIVS